MERTRILIVGFMFLACSSGPHSAGAPTSTSGVGRVHGVVRDVHTGKPLADLTVTVDDSRYHEGRTDRQGRFALDAVPAGRHIVLAYYQDASVEVPVDVVAGGVAEVVIHLDESQTGCTMNTCWNGLAINLSRPPEKGVWIDAQAHLSGELDGKRFECATLLDRRQHECDLDYELACTGLAPGMLGVLVTEKDPSAGCGKRLLEQLTVAGQPKVVQFTITGIDVPISRTLRPTYARDDPNGSSCDPHCSNAIEEVSW